MGGEGGAAPNGRPGGKSGEVGASSRAAVSRPPTVGAPPRGVGGRSIAKKSVAAAAVVVIAGCCMALVAAAAGGSRRCAAGDIVMALAPTPCRPPAAVAAALPNMLSSLPPPPPAPPPPLPRRLLSMLLLPPTSTGRAVGIAAMAPVVAVVFDVLTAAASYHSGNSPTHSTYYHTPSTFLPPRGSGHLINLQRRQRRLPGTTPPPWQQTDQRWR